MNRTLTLAACLMAASSLAFAQEARKPDCTKGDPWRLPTPKPPYTTSEAFVKVDGTAGRMVHICNCTAETQGKDASVWVNTSTAVPERLAATRFSARNAAEPPPDIPTNTGSAYLLASGSCTDVGTANVWLRPGDHTIESWGTFELRN